MVGENVRQYRQARKLSQQALADKVGISQPMLAQIERGTKGLSIQLGVVIAEALEVDAATLFGLRHSPQEAS